MSRIVKLIIGVVVAVALAVAGGLLYIYITGGSGEASAPLTVEEVNSDEGALVFTIVPEESLVSFELDEVLMGQPKTVVGTTNQISGQISVNPDSPAESEIGTIEINVRTLATDSGLRDRAIRSQILQSALDDYEFAHFIPAEITGMPESVTVGEAFTFQVTGDLVIKGITQSVTFEATVTAVSETRLEGSANTTVTREMYNMQIPNAPGVANVEEEVLLTINFVAVSGAEATPEA